MTKHQTNFKAALDYPNRITNLLFAQVARHEAMRNMVREVIPGQLAKHLSDCIIKENRLLLYVESAAWASQLRFYSPIIRTMLATKFPETIDAVQVKVLVHNPVMLSRNDHRRANIPSPATIACLRRSIQSSPDSELKEALLRLSETLRRQSGQS